MRGRVSQTSAIGDVISKLLAQAGTQHDALQRIQEAWVAVVGEDLAAHSKPVSFRRNIVYVHADEPGTSYLLGLKKRALVPQLQAAVASPIEDVVIRAGSVR